MRKILTVAYYYASDIISKFVIRKKGKEDYYSSLKKYAGHKLLDAEEANLYIKEKIQSGEPFCAGRYGASELFCSSMFEFDVVSKKEKAIDQLYTWSGFFPNDVEKGNFFNKILIDSSLKLDIVGIWNLRFEEYYLKKYAKKDIRLTYLYNLEPWTSKNNPWTEALKGKNVLVVHPFADTIVKQYNKRKEIFLDSRLLPDFNLITFKAVQTIAGTKDERFNDWFAWMYEEIKKIDFDIAIIGCGAYGLPLAAKIKEIGKQAIHLGGSTQIMFGIKGKRWDEDTDKEYIRKLYSDAWVYPNRIEKPQNAKAVEDGCYW